LWYFIKIASQNPTKKLSAAQQHQYHCVCSALQQAATQNPACHERGPSPQVRLSRVGYSVCKAVLGGHPGHHSGKELEARSCLESRSRTAGQENNVA